jgi:tRNA(Ile2) C34 agmatinyltransferase TiaS
MEQVISALPINTLQKPIRPPIEDCPRCNGQTEMNGDRRLACHFCGNVFEPRTVDMPAAA